MAACGACRCVLHSAAAMHSPLSILLSQRAPRACLSRGTVRAHSGDAGGRRSSDAELPPFPPGATFNAQARRLVELAAADRLPRDSPASMLLYAALRVASVAYAAGDAVVPPRPSRALPPSPAACCLRQPRLPAAARCAALTLRRRRGSCGGCTAQGGCARGACRSPW
jgi:hypothetical protein